MRKAVMLCALGMLFPAVTFGLGLGALRVESSLNAPLRAGIPLLGVSEEGVDQIHAEIGGEAAFRRIGLDRPYWLTNIRFHIAPLPGGGHEIRLTTREPVREPMVSLVVALTWPGGHMFRDYTILLDPPRYRSVQASAPVATSGGTPPVPPHKRADRRATRSTPGTYGPVKSGETAWEIAAQVRPDSALSVERTLMALLRKNPHAFIHGNVNLLRAGVTLDLPTRDEVHALAAGEARTAFHEQVHSWRQKTGSPVGAPTAAPRLEILGAEDITDGGDAVWRLEEQKLSLRAERDDYRRNNEALSRENVRLQDRVERLERTVAEVRELLAKRDAQYARLTQELASVTPASGLGRASETRPQSGPATKAGDRQAPDMGVKVLAPRPPSEQTDSSRPQLWRLLGLGIIVLCIATVGLWLLLRYRAGKRVPDEPGSEASDATPQTRSDSLESGLIAIDLALAYRQFAQAGNLLAGLTERFPNHPRLLAKRLEIYALHKDRNGFSTYFDQVAGSLQRKAPGVWSDVKRMGREVMPDDPRFR